LLSRCFSTWSRAEVHGQLPSLTSYLATQSFSPGSVGFWHSEGGDPLKQEVAPQSASASSNGQDWHLGVLELPRSGYSDGVEDFYFSGVYIETGPITKEVGGPKMKRSEEFVA